MGGAEEGGIACRSSEFFRWTRAAVAAGAGEQGPLRGGLHAGMRVSLGQADHAEATTIAHLSGCGLSAIIRSNSCDVCGPIVCAHSTMREGGHSRSA